MDFSDADRTPEVLLNEILWRAMKGADSPMPPPAAAPRPRRGDAATTTTTSEAK